MAPPLPTVAAQGQGSVGSDQLNTYVQTVQNFAQLRSFAALNDMSVQVLGGASEGDGLQGLFWYDAASTAADNNATVIVPTGNTQGAWLLLPPGSQSPGNFASLDVSGNAVVGGNLSIGGTLATTGVATFDADVLMVGTGEAQIPVGTTAQRSGAPAPGMIRYNTSLSIFEGYGASWQPLAGTGIAQPPGGRLTLTSGVPVLLSAVISAVGVIYTPYLGNTIPQWNGTTWSPTTFVEISQSLSDTTNSPAAAVASGLYDLFVWFKAGVATLSRGPAWTNSTTRSLSLTRTLGFLTNFTLITNGPAAGYGFYVGTIACDAGGATVTFNPTPAAASGGPSGGAWVGLWNEYNRVPVWASAQDSKASWAYATASWRSSDNSTNNRITAVFGVAEDGASASFTETIGANSATSYIGVGIDSVTVPTIATAVSQGLSGDLNSSTATAIVGGLTGQHYFQALEYSSTATFYGFSVAQVHQISAQLRY